jgi:hypothetical protein
MYGKPAGMVAGFKATMRPPGFCKKHYGQMGGRHGACRVKKLTICRLFKNISEQIFNGFFAQPVAYPAPENRAGCCIKIVQIDLGMFHFFAKIQSVFDVA